MLTSVLLLSARLFLVNPGAFALCSSSFLALTHVSASILPHRLAQAPGLSPIQRKQPDDCLLSAGRVSQQEP